MKKIKPSVFYHINVKIPEPLIEIIDSNLAKGGALYNRGFTSRAHFVKVVVAEELLKLNLLDKKMAADIAKKRLQQK